MNYAVDVVLSYRNQKNFAQAFYVLSVMKGLLPASPSEQVGV